MPRTIDHDKGKRAMTDRPSSERLAQIRHMAGTSQTGLIAASVIMEVFNELDAVTREKAAAFSAAARLTIKLADWKARFDAAEVAMPRTIERPTCVATIEQRDRSHRQCRNVAREGDIYCHVHDVTERCLTCDPENIGYECTCNGEEH